LSEIFLSYASADRARVAPLVHALEAEGLQVWWDRDIDSGQSFHKVIQQALTAAPAVIVVWTNESVQSEWVLNEASDARTRDRLVPVLLDPVTPPLEFRHLQAADLSGWEGDSADPQFIGLHKGVLAILRQTPGSPTTLGARPTRQWWQTWPGQALGAGGLLLGLSVLLLTLKQVGVIGPQDSTVAKPFPPSSAQAPTGRPEVKFDDLRQTHVPPTPGASPVESVNLVDTDAGAQLLTANQAAWKPLFSGPPTSAVLSLNGFAVLALRGDKPVAFDTLAIHVEATDIFNVKELAIHVSSTSPEGPFVKAAQITVPNYRNMQKPFHELHFEPVQARFVKLQVLSSQGDIPLARVGSIQLYASNSVR